MPLARFWPGSDPQGTQPGSLAPAAAGGGEKARAEHFATGFCLEFKERTGEQRRIARLLTGFHIDCGVPFR